jgi:RNA polymerase sigma-70 factor (ECF subfamily)
MCDRHGRPPGQGGAEYRGFGAFDRADMLAGQVVRDHPRPPVTSDPDLRLLERWRAGDRRAGEELFGRHFRDIYRFFEHKAGADADELAQRTFIACVAPREQFRAQSTFRTYMFTVARHELYAYLRRRRPAEPIDFHLSSLADLAPSPLSQVERSRIVGRLREVMNDMPAEQQLLLELHYWHDLDASALAEVFGAPSGTIRIRLMRARQSLRARMAERDGVKPKCNTQTGHRRAT